MYIEELFEISKDDSSVLLTESEVRELYERLKQRFGDNGIAFPSPLSPPPMSPPPPFIPWVAPNMPWTHPQDTGSPHYPIYPTITCTSAKSADGYTVTYAYACNDKPISN